MGDFLDGRIAPQDVIELMTYLVFIHDLDATDDLRARECAMLGLPHKSMFAGEITIGDRKVDGRQPKWSVFRDFEAARMYSMVQELVFPFIKNLGEGKNSAYSKYMGDAIFKLPTPLMLSRVVDSMDAMYELIVKNPDDNKGDLYEYLLNKLSQSGINGQFRTPRNIIQMMVQLMEPKPGYTICGTAGFLVAAEEYLSANFKKEPAVGINDRQRRLCDGYGGIGEAAGSNLRKSI